LSKRIISTQLDQTKIANDMQVPEPGSEIQVDLEGATGIQDSAKKNESDNQLLGSTENRMLD